ncbi:MAG: sigma-54-dependent Fis family transcriptional regulator [Desulfosarcina sp.]|nr:sigma-54-dependent Fis family transcriptional regulator [Desulfosarcina sp.]MBC2742205.1 sigma-54-dependent Fis family transcriptional regulator [Desulfosarcina sp.]MBC2765117.1 sigma-54-dependent Fis family transcriptional regulator [Desulfosarcina sp.]
MSTLNDFDMVPMGFDYGLGYLEDEALKGRFLDQAQGRSGVMRQLYEQVRLVASTNSTVLITGETGTGKSFLARLIHLQSSRKESPFISVHCGAIPETLIESELFGHEKGAFTGAVKRKQGRFALANGGTIFLDEIGTVIPAIQIKLLQFLQDHTFQPVGSEETMEADLRVLAATNSDPKQMVDEGYFRSDLFYRLNVFPLHIPPLRERREDIPLLTQLFIKRLNRLYGRKIAGVSQEVEQAFFMYDWPGNIRELENLIERAFILEKGEKLGPKSFPPELFNQDCMPPALDSDKLPALRQFRAKVARQAELQYLIRLLTINKGRIALCAATAGVSTRQLHKLMTKHGLRKKDFK